MLFEIEAKKLLELLKGAKAGLTGRSVQPAQNGIALAQFDDRLTVTTTDLEFIQVRLTAECTGADTDGVSGVVVPAWEFTEFVAAADGPIMVRCDDGTRVTVTSGNASIRLSGHAWADWQDIPAPNAAPIQINGPALAGAIATTEFAAGRDDSRPRLTGIMLEPHDAGDHGTFLRLTASDTYRLASDLVYLFLDDPAKAPAPAIIPLAAMKTVRSHADDDSVITIRHDGSVFEAKGDGWEVRGRLIEGEPVNWRKVVPETLTAAVSVVSDDLRRAVHRVLIVARGDANRVVMNAGETGGPAGETALLLSAKDKDGADITDSVPARLVTDYPFPTVPWGLNGHYLLDAIGAIDSERVAIAVNEVETEDPKSGEKAVAIVGAMRVCPAPGHGIEFQDTFVQVLMPMFVSE